MKINREWSMPSKNTFDIEPIRKFVYRHKPEGVTIDPFANRSKIANITNDLNPAFDTTYNMNALAFLRMFDDNSVDCVLFDPPYSPRQVKECYDGFGAEVTQDDTMMSFWSDCKKEVARIVRVTGVVMCFGWNSMGIGKNRGFEITEILLVPHGANKNDTICVAEIKTQGKLF